MDILNKFKQNGYFTAELYHLLAKKKFVDPTEEVSVFYSCDFFLYEIPYYIYLLDVNEFITV